MPYAPKTWENKPSTASPINATNLNHMEGGIKTNDDNIVDAQNAILTLQGEMLQAQGDISALETLVDSILPVDTESGNPTVITDAFGGACKSLKLTLEPIQSGSGTPSPQNVRPISGRTQSVVTRTGKNLCEEILAGYPDTNQNKIIGGAYTSAVFFGVAGMTVVASANQQNRFVLAYVGNKKPEIGDTFSRIYQQQNYYTLESTGYYVWYVCNSTTDHVQVEIGTIATAYEAYNGATYTVDLDGTRYGGTVDFKTGILTVIYAIVDLGTKDWNAASNVGRVNSITSISGALNPARNDRKADMLCSKYEVLPYYVNGQSGYDANSTLDSMGIFASNGGTVFIYDSALSNMTGAQVKAALSGTIVCYKLATPTIVQLTAEEVTLLKGDNVLTTDANSIEASYSADIALYIDKKIAEGSQNNRSLSKGGSSDEKVKEEEKEEEIKIKETEPLTKEVR